MIVLGSNSEVAQAFVEKVLSEGTRFEKVYLLTSSKETTEKFANHIDVKYFQPSEIIEVDLMKNIDYHQLDHIKSDLLFCDVLTITRVFCDSKQYVSVRFIVYLRVLRYLP